MRKRRIAPPFSEALHLRSSYVFETKLCGSPGELSHARCKQQRTLGDTNGIPTIYLVPRRWKLMNFSQTPYAVVFFRALFSKNSEGERLRYSFFQVLTRVCSRRRKICSKVEISLLSLIRTGGSYKVYVCRWSMIIG